MKKTYIGLDNGTSGSIGIINYKGELFFAQVPCRSAQDYTKKKKNITRINHQRLWEILDEFTEDGIPMLAIVERPMVNPTRFVATTSALRALEAVLIILEETEIPYIFIDSKEWQKEMLPSGIQGHKELKKASMDIGQRLFPAYHDRIKSHYDADGLLIAEYARRKGL